VAVQLGYEIPVNSISQHSPCTIEYRVQPETIPAWLQIAPASGFLTWHPANGETSAVEPSNDETPNGSVSMSADMTVSLALLDNHHDDQENTNTRQSDAPSHSPMLRIPHHHHQSPHIQDTTNTGINATSTPVSTDTNTSTTLSTSTASENNENNDKDDEGGDKNETDSFDANSQPLPRISPRSQTQHAAFHTYPTYSHPNTTGSPPNSNDASIPGTTNANPSSNSSKRSSYSRLSMALSSSSLKDKHASQAWDSKLSQVLMSSKLHGRLVNNNYRFSKMMSKHDE
jgi:hypothetical protein